MGIIDRFKGIFTKDQTHIERVEALARRIESDGRVTEAELAEFEEAILADGKVTPDEQRLLNALVARIGREQEDTTREVATVANRIQEDGVVTPEELAELNAAVMADGHMSDEERRILMEIIDKLRTRKLREA